MSKTRILSISFRKNGERKEIDISDMTKDFFKKNREFIFCPNNSCNAHIEFSQGSKVTFFHTKRASIDGDNIIEEHDPDCIYGVEHNVGPKQNKIYDANIGFVIPNKQIKNALNRANTKHLKKDDESNLNSDINKTRKKKSKVAIKKSTGENVLVGKAVIGVVDSEEEQIVKPRNGSLFQKYVDDITTKDFNEPRIVKGNLEKIEYHESYITMKLVTSDGHPARIFFSEEFKVNNRQQFAQMAHYEKYIAKKNNNGEKPFVCCAGEIKEDYYGISVYAKAHDHFTIDAFYHYDLLRSLESEGMILK